MKHRQLAVGLAILLTSFSVAGRDVLCTHTAGERLFKGLTVVRVATDGKTVTVGEEWTYRIVATGTNQTFRAVRFDVASPFDLYIGGEFFLLDDGPSLVGFAVGINAASRQSASESFVCRSAS